MYVSELFGQKFITIEVNNAEKLLLRQTGLKKLLMTWNKNVFSSPVQISSNALKCNFEELYEIIERQVLARHLSDT